MNLLQEDVKFELDRLKKISKDNIEIEQEERSSNVGKVEGVTSHACSLRVSCPIHACMYESYIIFQGVKLRGDFIISKYKVY